MHPLLLAALIVLCEGLSLTALFPIIHAHVAELGGSPFWIGLLFALVAGPKVVANPAWGWAGDHYGRRPMLMIITLGTMTASIGWALAPNLIWLAVARTIAGVFGAQSVLAMAIAADVSPNRRAAAMAAVGAAFGLAFTIGPPLGGWLGDRYGYAEVGWLSASFQMVSLLLIVFGLRETAAPIERTPITRGWMTILRRPGVPFGMIALGAMSAATMGLIASLGKYTEVLYGYDTRQAGMLLGAFGLIGAIAQGGIRPLVRRIGEELLAGFSLALLCVGCVGLVLRPEAGGFWASVSLIAVGAAAATTCLSALLSHRVSADVQGRLMGLQQSVTGLGRTFGAGLSGWALGQVGPAGPGALAAALALLAMTCVLCVPRMGPVQADPPAAR